MPQVDLTPIREMPKEYEKIEAELKALFKKEIYIPIARELKLNLNRVKNAESDDSSYLRDAITSGRITFYRGQFKGRFNSTLSRELHRIGAKWDAKQGSFSIPQSQLSQEIQSAILASYDRFERTAAKMDEKLAKIIPAEIADKLKIEKIFDTTLWKVDNEFNKSVKGFAVAPKLTEEQKERIVKEYSENMKLSIKGWMDSEIKELREKIQQNVNQGFRYETMIKTIETSYGVSQNKAKFLARQETNLLITKFKQTRYQSAGIEQYKWVCVRGSSLHPVRPMHQKLNDRSAKGELFSWSNPPVDDEDGKRHNPGENFNCRCVAIPVVRF